MEQNKNNSVVTITPQEQEIQLLRIKQDTEFAATPVGQQVKQFEATQRIARLYAMSNFIPDSYRFKGREPLPAEAVIANCTIALDMATRMQANPLMVMQNLYIVHGQPAFSSKFLIACINASKRFSALRYEFRGTEGTDDYACRVVAYEITDTKHKEPLCGDWISIKMAKSEGWVSKNGSKWLTMPNQMLRYRAAAFWQRTYCPEISMGLITAEEAQDIKYTSYEEVGKRTADATELSISAIAEQAAEQDENAEENVEQQTE